jgi:hypothetical protein
LADCALSKIEQEMQRHTKSPRQVLNKWILRGFLALGFGAAAAD